MKHSIEELIGVAYRYYPRGVSWEDPGRTQAEEYLRLVDARRQAGADRERWLAMLRRLRARFPENGVDEFSVRLMTGQHDACYCGSLYLPKVTGERWHTVEFRVSILVPCYITYSSRIVDDLDEIERRKALASTPPRITSVYAEDTMFVLPASVVKPEFIKPISTEATRQDLSFDLSPDEQPYAEWIARDIEAAWGYERMLPEIGRVIVPDVATDARALGEATLYDCLFSDNW